MLGRGEEDSLSSRKKERRALLFSGENRHGMVSHARSYHRGISSGNDDKMALKINGCVSSALSLFPSIFLSLSLSLVFLSLFLTLSSSPSFTGSFLLYPTLHCLIPRFLYPWLTLSRPLPLQSLIAMVTLLAIPAILTYIL